MKRYALLLLLLPGLGSAATLSERLMSTEVDTRTSAHQEASALSPEDLKKLITDLSRRLKKDDINERERAALALGMLGPRAEGAIEALRKALNDDLPYVRIRSAESLTKIGPASIPAFREALKNQSSEVRAIAAEALGYFGPKAHEAIPDLVKALTDRDAPIRQRAAHALEQMGAPAAAALLDYLESPSASSKLLVLQILANTRASLEANAVPRLMERLKDQDRQVRLAAAKALLHQSHEQVSKLEEGLKSDDASVRGQVADIFADLGRRGASAVPMLTELLKDPVPLVRGAAARALGKMGSQAAKAIPALRETAKDSDAFVAAKSAEALTNITAVFGGASTPKNAIVPDLTLPPPEPDPAPVKAAPPQKKAPAARKASIPKGKMKTPLPVAAPLPTPGELLIQLQSPDVAVSSNAAEAIVQRSSETMPLLLEALQGPSTSLALLSEPLLVEIGTPEAQTAVEAFRQRVQGKRLASLLKDLRQEGPASLEAATALVRLGAPVVTPVSQILADPRPFARRAAATVLNRLGGISTPAASSLIQALDDKDAGVRQQAAEALAKIGTPDSKKALRFFPIKDKIRRLVSVFFD